MKKLVYLFLLIFTGATAQTSYTNDDIQASANNQYETLLTNVELGSGDVNIQSFLQKNDFIFDSDYNQKNRLKLSKQNEFTTARYKSQTVTGEGKQTYIFVKLYMKKAQALPLITKVELYGDIPGIINFYCNFWSRELNFNDVKIGEVVSTRFLSDVATLSFPDASTAKITIVTAKDR